MHLVCVGLVGAPFYKIPYAAIFLHVDKVSKVEEGYLGQRPSCAWAE